MSFMPEWFKRLVGARYKMITAAKGAPVEDTLLDAIHADRCPDCGGKEWLSGPRGGGSENIKCADPKCGSEFNVGYALGSAFFVERISQPSPLAPTRNEASTSYFADGADPGPDQGHTFRFSVTSRMSSTVVGEKGHRDADEFMGGAFKLDVRAFSLPEACDVARRTSLEKWAHVDYADAAYDQGRADAGQTGAAD